MIFVTCLFAILYINSVESRREEDIVLLRETKHNNVDLWISFKCNRL